MYAHRLCECHTWNIPLLRQDGTWGSECTPVSTPHLVAGCLRELQIKAIVSWSEPHWFRDSEGYFIEQLQTVQAHVAISHSFSLTRQARTQARTQYQSPGLCVLKPSYLTAGGLRNSQPFSISCHNVCFNTKNTAKEKAQKDVLMLHKWPCWHLHFWEMAV